MDLDSSSSPSLLKAEVEKNSGGREKTFRYGNRSLDQGGELRAQSMTFAMIKNMGLADAKPHIIWNVLTPYHFVYINPTSCIVI